MEEIYILSYPTILKNKDNKNFDGTINHRLYLSRNKGKKFIEISLPPIRQVLGVKSFDNGIVMKVELIEKMRKVLFGILLRLKIGDSFTLKVILSLGIQLKTTCYL